jgi:CRP/FNR family transcriptional regulator, cyclic AMP receptor protein
MKSTLAPAPVEPTARGHEILKALRLAETGIRRPHCAGRLAQADEGSASSRVLFAYLSEAETAAFLAQCSERHVPQHKAIFSQGRKHTTFLIKEGLVRTFYVSPSGKEITLAYWSAGEMIGGPYFFDDQRKNIWSAQATEDSVVLAIDGAQLQLLARRIPALALFLIESLSFKLHWVSLLLQTLGTEFVHCRLAILLLRLAELYGEPSDDAIVIRYNFTQSDLGAMVGATRQWVSTALGRLQREGIVRLYKRRLYILDLDRLNAKTISS